MSGRAQLGAFCVVAKVAVQTASGEGGLQLRRGVKHFSAGAKVWVLPPQWGDGAEKLIVVGHHRCAHGRGLVRMVVSRRHLTGFRVQGVYSPAVMRALTRPLAEVGRDDAPRLWSTREEAERAAATWRDRPLTARADDWSFTALVTDPPPMELAREGRTYYLAHFNARRAIYSHWPPPPEPPGSGRPPTRPTTGIMSLTRLVLSGHAPRSPVRDGSSGHATIRANVQLKVATSARAKRPRLALRSRLPRQLLSQLAEFTAFD